MKFKQEKELKKDIEKAIFHIKKADSLLAKNGFDITSKGLIKELIVASILGHSVSKDMHGADACNTNNRNEKYEYLCCSNNGKRQGTFQMDRMYGYTASKKQQKDSLKRITRNKYFFHCLFNRLNCLKIWSVETPVILKEAKEKLARCKSNHISFGQKWTMEKGEIVYEISNG